MNARYSGPAMFIAAFMTTFLVAGGLYSDAASPAVSIAYTIDAPRTLLGPSSGVDNAANSLGSRLYVGNVSTQGYTLPDAPLPLQGTVLSPGAAGSGTFDDCGAWLDTTWPDGALVRGIYHAEYVPAGASCSQAHRMSVGYAESVDGGRTFYKPGYPNNQIISGPDAYSATGMTGVGQPYLRVGNDGYLYLYFQAARDSWTVHVARAPISSGGARGAWRKLYQGAWTEPGLGGQSTKLATGTVLGRSWVDYSGALGKYIGVAWTPSGYGLAASPDGLSGWALVIPQIIELNTSHNWGNRASDGTPLIDYPSLLGPGYTTGAGLGSDIEVAYMYVPAYENVGANRTLQVRTLHLQGTPTVTPTASPTASDTPTVPATATESAVPTATATSTPTPSATATVTPTATATAQGTPCRAYMLDGVISIYGCP